MLDFKGVIPALISPADRDGRLDVKRIPSVLQFAMKRGVHGMFVGGSTGEGFCLTTEERKRLAETVMDEVGKKIPVVIHVGSMRFREVIELAEHARSIGADGVSSVIPFYYRYNLEEIHSYYQAISEASQLPTLIYALSQVENTTFAPKEFIDAVMSIDRVYGIKFTNIDINRLQTLKQLSKDKLRFYGGVDVLALPMFVMGVAGIIGSNYTALPEPWIAIYEAFLKKDLPRAISVQERLTYYLRSFKHIEGTGRAKGLLRLRGVDAGDVFPPKAPLKPEDLKLLQGILEEMHGDPVLKGVLLD
ncbi:MAG TPA: dihydrodipicolinate synthase family protein [Spirochaetia bacterium]|nr:dihydrodipicolinate synthase family protein [Spirochaetia bacterium]